MEWRECGLWAGRHYMKVGRTPSTKHWNLYFLLRQCVHSKFSLPLTLPTGAFGALPWPGGRGKTQRPEARSKRARAGSSDTGSIHMVHNNHMTRFTQDFTSHVLMWLLCPLSLSKLSWFNKLDFIKIINFYSSKLTNKRGRRQATVWETILSTDISDRELIFKLLRTSID